MASRERGFTLYALLAAGAVMAGLGAAVWVQTARLGAVKAEYSAFQGAVKAAGEAQKAKNDELLKERERINHDRYKALQGRYADIATRYDRLRKQPNPDTRPMPAVPDTARPVDDAARDRLILEILRTADQQTAQLIELQEWVRSQPR